MQLYLLLEHKVGDQKEKKGEREHAHWPDGVGCTANDYSVFSFTFAWISNTKSMFLAFRIQTTSQFDNLKAPSINFEI